MPNRQVYSQPCLVGQNSSSAKVICTSWSVNCCCLPLSCCFSLLSYYWLHLGIVFWVVHASMLSCGLVRLEMFTQMMFYSFVPGHTAHRNHEMNTGGWYISCSYYVAELTPFGLWNSVGRKDPPLGKEGSKSLYLIHCTFYSHLLLVLLYHFLFGWQTGISLQECITVR